MTISFEGVLTLLGALFVAMLPLPRRAEGLRTGFFSALLAFVVFGALRAREKTAPPEPTPDRPAKPDQTSESEQPAPRDVNVDGLVSESEDRLDAGQLLADFSILRHLRRLGAVSDREFEAKKADILRRV